MYLISEKNTFKYKIKWNIYMNSTYYIRTFEENYILSFVQFKYKCTTYHINTDTYKM